LLVLLVLPLVDGS